MKYLIVAFILWATLAVMLWSTISTTEQSLKIAQQKLGLQEQP